MGLLATGRSCLEMVVVSGLSLVPLPPANTKAFIWKALPSSDYRIPPTSEFSLNIQLLARFRKRYPPYYSSLHCIISPALSRFEWIETKK